MEDPRLVDMGQALGALADYMRQENWGMARYWIDSLHKKLDLLRGEMPPGEPPADDMGAFL